MSELVQFIKRLPRTLANLLLRLIYRELSKPLEFLELKKILSENKKLEDIYKGEICFIVGNGPSIKNQNLLHLKNEHVFVVNSFPYTKLYENLKPKFYVTWDDIQFDWDNPEYGEYRANLFEKIAKVTPETIYILPAKEKSKIESRKILNNKDILYSYWGAKWKNYKKTNFDFKSQIPHCNNVVDIALMAAIYMGFSKIYLLGVDMTDFIKMYEYSWNKKIDDKYGHFYKYSKEEEVIMKEVLFIDSSNEERLRVAADKLMIFRYINDVAVNKGVKIINMTEGGGLDVFPRAKYINWIKEDE